MTLLEDNANLVFPKNMNAYLSNLISLGILSDMAGEYKTNKDNYEKINQRNRLDDLRNELVPNQFKSIDVEESFIRLTDFGKIFIEACIK